MVINTRIACCLVFLTSCLHASEKLTLQAAHAIDATGHHEQFCHFKAQEDGSLKITEWYHDREKSQVCCIQYMSNNSDDFALKKRASMDCHQKLEKHKAAQKVLTELAKATFGSTMVPDTVDATFLPGTNRLVLADKEKVSFYSVGEQHTRTKHLITEALAQQHPRKKARSSEKKTT